MFTIIINNHSPFITQRSDAVFDELSWLRVEIVRHPNFDLIGAFKLVLHQRVLYYLREREDAKNRARLIFLIIFSE